MPDTDAPMPLCLAYLALFVLLFAMVLIIPVIQASDMDTTLAFSLLGLTMLATGIAHGRVTMPETPARIRFLERFPRFDAVALSVAISVIAVDSLFLAGAAVHFSR